MNTTTGTTPDIPILHEDSHLLVIVKPAGLLSQRDRTGDPDLLTLCRRYLEQKQQRSGSQFLGLLHRLDRPVQGVMVLAKRPSAASHLSAQIRDRTFRKIYLAVVESETPPNGVLVHHLVKDPSTNHVTASKEEKPGQTQRAELSYVRLAYHPDENLTLLQIQLLTGRRHQIKIRDRTFRKIYLAVVESETPPNGVLVHHLVKDPSTNHVTASKEEKPGQTQRAELSYVRLAYHPDENLTLLQIQLLTGRPHQIRVQLASEGYPLHGDKKYGSSGGERGGVPALFASGLKFRHPESDKPVSYTADPPDHHPWSLFRSGS